MSFDPIRLDGGGCGQAIVQSPDGKSLVIGADTQGFYLSQTTPLATSWTVQQKGVGQAVHWRQCATLLWSSSETGVIYAGVGEQGSGGGMLAGTLSGSYPNQSITWAMRAAKPQWAGNHAGPSPAGLTTGGIARPTGNLLAQNASFLFAGTYQQGILRSSNSGGAGNDNFPTACNMAGTAPGTGNWFCYALGLDPVSGNLYAGFFDVNGNPAGMWQCTSPGAGTPNFTQIAGGPAMVQDIIFLGAYAYVAGGNDGLWRYGPIGGSPAWQNLNGSTIPQPAGVTSNYWSAVAGYVDGSSNHVVGIIDNNPPQNGAGCGYWATVPSNYPTGSITYATNGTTTIATEPGGYTWWRASSSYHNWFGGTGFFSPMLIVDASNLASVNWYMTGSEGGHRSLGGVANWRIADSGMPQFLGHPIAADPKVGKHIAIGDSDWGHIDDAAAGTETASTLMQAAAVGSAQGYAIAFDPLDSTVYAGFTGSGQKYSNSGGTLWSRPGAQPKNWTQTSFSQAGKNAIGLCALRQPDGSGQKILLVAVWGAGLFYGKLTAGAWSFTAAAGGGGACPSQAGNYASFSYYGGGLVYCYDRVTGLYRSTDYGQTWTLIWNKTGAGDIAANPATAGELWLVQNGNLWHLTGAGSGTVAGGGVRTAQIGNIPGSGNCSGAVAVDNHGNVLVTTKDAGAGSGLYRSANQGGSWTSLDTDGNLAACCLNPEHIVVGPDDYIYIATGNVVTFGLPGGTPPPPGNSAPFTELQASTNLAGASGVLGLWFSQSGGVASTPGTMLSARLELTDGSATVTPADPNWVLDLDVPAGAGTGVARVQIWRYSNNPGGLGSPAAMMWALSSFPGLRRPAWLAQSPAIFPGVPAAVAATGIAARAVAQIIGGQAQGPAGASLVVFTCDNPAATLKGKLIEYQTPAGTVQTADQTGSATGTTATSLPVTASAANSFTGGLAVASFATHWSPVPSGQSYTTPAGWTQDGVGNNATLSFATYYQTGITTGPTTVTGTVVPGSGGTQDFWAAGLVTYYALPGTPVSITTSSLPNGTVSVAYGPGGAGKQLTGAGGVTPYTWAVTAGALPTGLSLSAAGLITGTPSAAGAFTFTATVTDSAAHNGSLAFTITIAGGLTVATTSPLPGGTAGTAYGPGAAGVQLAGSGGTTPYTWAVTAGSLPPGLSLSAAGLVAGTPSLAGTYTFTAQVTDHLGATATAALSVTIAASTVLAITTAALPGGSLGAAYHGQLTASGGTPPYAWSVPSQYTGTYTGTYGTSPLPPGLILNPDGTITGTPSLAGTYTFTAQVTDHAGTTVQASFTITVLLGARAAPVTGPWRILFGPPQPAGGVTGEVLQAQNKTVTLRTEPGQDHQVSFDADGRDPAIAAIEEFETDLIVMFGSQIVFDGRVAPSQDTLTASAHRTVITALDYRDVLRRRAVLPGDQLSWTSVDQSVIAWNMIQATQARAGGNLGIDPGLGQSTGITRVYTATLGDYIGDDITNLALLDNGFEWQITPYGFADLRFDVFYPQQGTDREVVLAWGDARISSIVRNVDPATFATALYVTGDPAFNLTAQQLQAADIATRTEGRWDTVVGTTDNIQLILGARAAALLAQAQQLTPSYTIVFYPGAWAGPSDIWLGDTVTVQIDSGRLQVNSDLRVVEMAFAISADNVETLTLTVGAIPFRLNRAIAAVLKQLNHLGHFATPHF